MTNLLKERKIKIIKKNERKCRLARQKKDNSSFYGNFQSIIEIIEIRYYFIGWKI